VVVYDIGDAELDRAFERHGREGVECVIVEVGLSLEHLFGFLRTAGMMHGLVVSKT